MSRIRSSRRVEAPAATVWTVLTDLDAAARTIGAIESLERISGPDFGVGTRWRESRTMFGRTATEEMQVTSLDPGRSYTVESDGHGAHYVSVVAVSPLDERSSEVTMSFEAEPTGFVSRLLAATLGRLSAGSTRKMIASDLEDIAAAAERPHPNDG